MESVHLELSSTHIVCLAEHLILSMPFLFRALEIHEQSELVQLSIIQRAPTLVVAMIEYRHNKLPSAGTLLETKRATMSSARQALLELVQPRQGACDAEALEHIADILVASMGLVILPENCGEEHLT